MRLNLSEAGRRLGMSRTTVKKRIDQGSIKAVQDPETGRLLVDEDEIMRYESTFVAYIPVQETQVLQPSQRR